MCSISECECRVYGHGLCAKHYTRWRRYGDVDFVQSIRGNDFLRFNSSYKIESNGCWVWIKSLRCGYGRFFVGGFHYSAHRYSWEAANGDIPSGMQINHLCNNPSCVNPDHLYVGNQTENMRDMLMAGRGRHKKGESTALSKLTDSAVREIRGSLETTAKLARVYNVSESAVRSARKGKTWKHVL